MDSNHRYPRERSLLLPRSELAFEARVAIPGGLIEEVRFARDSPLEGDGFELPLEIRPEENCGFPGLAIA